MRLVFALAVTLACAGCNTVIQPAGMIPRWTTAWRDVATPGDRERLRDWRRTFVDALTAARKSGHSAEIAKEGALLDPDLVKKVIETPIDVREKVKLAIQPKNAQKTLMPP